MFIPVMSADINYISSRSIVAIKFIKNRSNKIEIHCNTLSGHWYEINTGDSISDIDSAHHWCDEHIRHFD